MVKLDRPYMDGSHEAQIEAENTSKESNIALLLVKLVGTRSIFEADLTRSLRRKRKGSRVAMVESYI